MHVWSRWLKPLGRLKGTILIFSVLPLFYGGAPQVNYQNLIISKETYLTHSKVKVGYLFDGKIKQFYTRAGTIKEAIASSEIPFEPFDITEPSLDNPISSGLVFKIIRAQPVTIVDGKKIIKTYSAYKSPYEIVTHSGIKVYPKDIVEFSSTTLGELLFGPKLTIRRAPFIYILDGQKTTKIQTWASKVEGVLHDLGIALGKNDKINFLKDEAVFSGMKIKIVRVSERITKLVVKIPVPTIYLDDPILPSGRLKIIKEGSSGQKIQIFKIRYENNLITSKKLLSEKIIKKATPEVVQRGTKPVYFGWATWYGSYFQGRRTASGEIYNMYALTAAHRFLPFGTLVRVTNLSTGRSVIVRINDRGPFSYHIIDLSFAAKQAILMDSLAWVSIEVIR